MKQPAIIVDRDGTAASCFKRPEDRSDSSWRQFNLALPFDAAVPAVVQGLQFIRIMFPHVAIIMTSGRSEGDHPGDRRRRFLMRQWVDKVSLPIDLLIMREGGDQRRDSIVKEEMYHVQIEPFYEVLFIIDDRPQVCDMWRSLGLNLIQVEDPGIEPLLLRGSPPQPEADLDRR